jgi:hypothetical protein
MATKKDQRNAALQDLQLLPGSTVAMPDGDVAVDDAARAKPDVLRKLIRDRARAERDGEELAAADLNNMGCAHAWAEEPNLDKARARFEQALDAANKAERKVIERNFEIVDELIPKEVARLLPAAGTVWRYTTVRYAREPAAGVGRRGAAVAKRAAKKTAKKRATAAKARKSKVAAKARKSRPAAKAKKGTRKTVSKRR